MTLDAGAESVHGPLPIPYTADEVGRTFSTLLDTFDFSTELHDLGIGSLSVFKRRKARRHLIAICVCLWRLALERSFPNDAAAFAEHFAATWPPLASGRGSATALRELVAAYSGLMAEKKAADFTVVADYMTQALGNAGEDGRRHQLKLSLRIRSLYETIFNNLIQVSQA